MKPKKVLSHQFPQKLLFGTRRIWSNSRKSGS